MGKINFTQENKTQLESLAVKFLFENVSIETTLGTTCNIVELIHATSIKSLTIIYQNLKKKINTLEEADRWSRSETENTNLEFLKEKLTFIDLLIGYKKWLVEEEELKRKKTELTEKLEELKESQKSPADRIAELEAELAKL